MTTVSRRPASTVDLTVAAALAGCAAASAAVPDPDAAPGGLDWRWVVRTDCLDLYAAQAGSPDWRATCLGAGAALHRARVALAAEGLAATVTLLPETVTTDRRRPALAAEETGHLARLVPAGSIAVTEQALELYDATEAATAVAVPAPAGPPSRAVMRALARELVGAARAEGSRLRVVVEDDELAGVLHGADTREAWLRAGAALSAVRLTARRLGLSTVLIPEPHRASSWGRRRIGEREGWLGVGTGTPYARLRLTPAGR